MPRMDGECCKREELTSDGFLCTEVGDTMYDYKDVAETLRAESQVDPKKRHTRIEIALGSTKDVTESTHALFDLMMLLSDRLTHVRIEGGGNDVEENEDFPTLPPVLAIAMVKCMKLECVELKFLTISKVAGETLTRLLNRKKSSLRQIVISDFHMTIDFCHTILRTPWTLRALRRLSFHRLYNLEDADQLQTPLLRVCGAATNLRTFDIIALSDFSLAQLSREAGIQGKRSMKLLEITSNNTLFSPSFNDPHDIDRFFTTVAGLSLETLKLNGVGLDSSSLAPMARAFFNGGETLQELQLLRNPLFAHALELDMHNFCTAIASLPCLETFCLDLKQPKEEAQNALGFLFEGLAYQNSPLKKLCVPSFGKSGTSAGIDIGWVQWIQYLHNLETLELTPIDGSDPGWPELLKAFQYNASLTRIKTEKGGHGVAVVHKDHQEFVGSLCLRNKKIERSMQLCHLVQVEDLSTQIAPGFWPHILEEFANEIADGSALNLVLRALFLPLSHG